MKKPTQEQLLTEAADTANALNDCTIRAHIDPTILESGYIPLPERARAAKRRIIELADENARLAQENSLLRRINADERRRHERVTDVLLEVIEGRKK